MMNIGSIAIPTGRMPIVGPKPFRVEYPYGLPDDCFRNLNRDGKASCVAYHRGVDPRELLGIRAGNQYRYDTDDERFREMVEDMRENGFRGGDGQRLHVTVSPDDCWVAEGNHRLRAAIAAGLDSVDIEIRYLANADLTFHLIPFDPDDPDIRVIHE